MSDGVSLSGDVGGYINGHDRNQTLLLPEVLDRYVAEDNEARFIDAFVDSLNLEELGFTRSQPNREGRPPYNPGDMLKLFIWGYLNQIRSSRKLERECHRNLEVIWLMKKLAPDFKTIADFRKDNADCVKSVFKQFIYFLENMDLFGGNLVSIDGSKFKAVNANKRNFNTKRLADRLKRIEEKTEKYLREMEENDRNSVKEEAEARALLLKRKKYLGEKLEKLEKRMQELKEISKRLKESGQSEISLTDPDSRLMINNGKFEVCYNVQTSVDDKNKLIADYDVVNEPSDANQLNRMAKSTKEALHADRLEVLSDTGYFNGEEIKGCLENGIVPYVHEPPQKTTISMMGVPEREFYKERFVYNDLRDTYTCPAGHEMSFLRLLRDNNRGKVCRVYATKECESCEFMGRCTRNKRGRPMYRWEHEKIIEEMRERLKREPLKMAKRRELSEHPFGTIKRAFNQAYLLLKGLRKVKGEVGFTMLVYNMRRALNILGVRTLLASLG